MLALSVVDNIDGTAAAHFLNPTSSRNITLRDRVYERLYILDTDVVALPPMRRSELFQVVRYNTNGGVLTWIGVYTSMPAELNMRRPRVGNYCGAGAWFLNSRIEAESVLPTIRALLTTLCERIDDLQNPNDWRIATLRMEDLGLSGASFSKIGEHRLLNPAKVGHERLCLDLTVFRKQDNVAAYIDQIQENDEYDKYAKILLSADPVIVENIMSNNRIAVQRVEDRPRKPHIEPIPRDQTDLPLVVSTADTRADAWQRSYAKENSMNETADMRRRVSFLEEEYAGQERAHASKIRQLGTRTFYSLVWNAALSAMLVVLIVYPRFTASDVNNGAINPAGASATTRPTSVSVELRSGETRNLGDHPSGDDSIKPNDVRPSKSEDCRGRGVDCLMTNNQAEIDGLDDATKSIQDALTKIQAFTERNPTNTSKQYMKMREVVKALKNDVKPAGEIIQALRESAQHPNK